MRRWLIALAAPIVGTTPTAEADPGQDGGVFRTCVFSPSAEGFTVVATVFRPNGGFNTHSYQTQHPPKNCVEAT